VASNIDAHVCAMQLRRSPRIQAIARNYSTSRSAIRAIYREADSPSRSQLGGLFLGPGPSPAGVDMPISGIFKRSSGAWFCFCHPTFIYVAIYVMAR